MSRPQNPAGSRVLKGGRGSERVTRTRALRRFGSRRRRAGGEKGHFPPHPHTLSPFLRLSLRVPLLFSRLLALAQSQGQSRVYSLRSPARLCAHARAFVLVRACRYHESRRMTWISTSCNCRRGYPCIDTADWDIFNGYLFLQIVTLDIPCPQPHSPVRPQVQGCSGCAAGGRELEQIIVGLTAFEFEGHSVAAECSDFLDHTVGPLNFEPALCVPLKSLSAPFIA